MKNDEIQIGKRPYSIIFDPAENMTKQSFKDECDINKIMEKFQKTGLISHYAAHGPTYQDIPAVDYLDAQYIIAEANSQFEELPSSIRKRFENDPSKFLDFVQDKKNLPELRELGLAKPLDTTLSDDEPKKPPKKRASAPSEPSGDTTPKDV